MLFYAVLLAILSFLTSYFIIPRVIYWSKSRNLLDTPDARKSHTIPTPTMGGIGVFVGVLISSIVMMAFMPDTFHEFKYILAAITLLFITGLIDDLKDINAFAKLGMQVVVAYIAVVAGIRIESFYGIFGIEELPLYLQYIFTVFLIVGITNAFNLLDGIDGLAGGIGVINSFVLGVLLWNIHVYDYAILAFILGAALFAFLQYNFNPAKIFMGDTGSLVVGFLLVVLAVKAIQVNAHLQIATLSIPNIVVLASSVLLVPVYDTVRVFTKRVLNKKSPFSADSTHLHHRFLKIGFNHRQTALIIYFLNVFVISVGAVLIYMEVTFAIMLLYAVTVTSCEVVFIIREITVAKRRKMIRDQRAEQARNILSGLAS